MSAATSARTATLLLFGTCALLLFPAHELAHYSVYRMLGVSVQMTLNTASPTDHHQRRPIAEFAGPLFNLGIATAAAALYLRRPFRKRWLAELALAAALMRLVVYSIILIAALITGSGLSMGNDEPIAAR